MNVDCEFAGTSVSDCPAISEGDAHVTRRRESCGDIPRAPAAIALLAIGACKATYTRPETGKPLVGGRL